MATSRALLLMPNDKGKVEEYQMFLTNSSAVKTSCVIANAEFKKVLSVFARAIVWRSARGRGRVRSVAAPPKCQGQAVLGHWCFGSDGTLVSAFVASRE